MARVAIRQLALYAVLLGIVWGAVVFVVPNEADIPARTETAWPTIAVHGLQRSATDGRIGFTALTATPRSARGSITLGGWREGLDLRQVRVELAAGFDIAGTSGTWVESRLTVEGKVVIERDGRRLLEAGRVEIVGDQMRFTGLVALHPASGPSTTVVDLETSCAALVARLR